MKNSPDTRRAVYALYGILSAAHLLNEELLLFAREPKLRSKTENQAALARERVLKWCMDQLHAGGWDVAELERTADSIAFSILQHAQAVTQLSPEHKEAYYLYAVANLLNEFCKRYLELGRQCSETPIPELQHALSESLRHDYAVKPEAYSPEQKTLIDYAQELASKLQAWMTAIH